jgi:hypothetical protein
MILNAQVDEIVIIHVHVFEWLVGVVQISEGDAGRVDQKKCV